MYIKQLYYSQSSYLHTVAKINWAKLGCIYSLDWTTGLTFDPKMLIKICNFALIGNPRMLLYPFSGWEDRFYAYLRSSIHVRQVKISHSSYFQAG